MKQIAARFWFTPREPLVPPPDGRAVTHLLAFPGRGNYWTCRTELPAEDCTCGYYAFCGSAAWAERWRGMKAPEPHPSFSTL